MSNATSQSQAVVRSSFPVLGLLGSVLVVLKLLGYINISWWFVLMPFYIGLAILVAVLLIAVTVAGMGWLVMWFLDWRDERKPLKRTKK